MAKRGCRHDWGEGLRWEVVQTYMVGSIQQRGSFKVWEECRRKRLSQREIRRWSASGFEVHLHLPLTKDVSRALEAEKGQGALLPWSLQKECRHDTRILARRGPFLTSELHQCKIIHLHWLKPLNLLFVMAAIENPHNCLMYKCKHMSS